MVSVAVKDFGPIIEGAVEIKPLTVFIGPNNSGKSHLATLVYALMQGRILPSLLPGMDTILFNEHLIPQLFEPENDIATEVNTWIAKKVDAGCDITNISVMDLPQKFVHALETVLKEQILVMFARPFDDRLTQCFGAEVSTLSRAGNNSHRKFSVSLKNDSPEWHLMATPGGKKIEASIPTLSFANESVNLRAESAQLTYAALTGRLPYVGQFRYGLASEIWTQVFRALYRRFPDITYYLPAARTGILQSHKQLASAIVRRSPFVGIEPVEIDRLSGVVADFISELLTLEPEKRAELYEVAEFLEKKIARGRIYLESAGVPYPEIAYETQGQKFRMHRVSSMVSELAPLILYLKHRLAPGDLLIFEEPESHLHPENQRILAHAIVKMVRKGVKVMITTHSDYFLPQLGNFVRLSALPEERARRGYDDEDYLNPDDVGCYLFAWDDEEGGSVVQELEVSAADGIVEDEFYSVDEAMYDEYIELEGAYQK